MPRSESDLLFQDEEDDGIYASDDESTSLLKRPGLYRQSPEKIAPPQTADPPRPAIGLLGLTMLAYFCVSGGPFGLEVAVAAGGPARTLIALMGFAIFSALPSAMMTAEMSSALPGRAGFVHWVDRGLSPRLGVLNSWISLLNTAVDASAYPGVCCDYVMFGLRRWAAIGPVNESTAFFARAATSFTLTCMICVINMAGIKLATRTAVALAVVSFAPFALMVLLCLLQPAASSAGSAVVQVSVATLPGSK